jgi:hypothetical protein
VVAECVLFIAFQNHQYALKGRNRMPQSLAQILVHLVFSTKNREALNPV